MDTVSAGRQIVAVSHGQLRVPEPLQLTLASAGALPDGVRLVIGTPGGLTVSAGSGDPVGLVFSGVLLLGVGGVFGRLGVWAMSALPLIGKPRQDGWVGALAAMGSVGWFWVCSGGIHGSRNQIPCACNCTGCSLEKGFLAITCSRGIADSVSYRLLFQFGHNKLLF